MTIEQEVKQLINNHLAEQKLRRESITFKQVEIEKYTNFIINLQEKISEIEKETKQESLHLLKLIDIKKNLKEESKPMEQNV